MDLFRKNELLRGQSRYGRDTAEAVKNAGWEESKHPRADDGKFGSGGGSGGSGGGDDGGKKGGDDNVIGIKTGTPLKDNPKQKAEASKTESGKPIYMKAKKSDYKDYSGDELIEVAQYLGMVQSNLSEKYHREKNQDGTISKKQIAARKRIKSEIESVVQQKGMVRDILEPSNTPDQKDFDKMDRENDPDKRSKASRKAKKE